MNELAIKVSYENERVTVSGRELHEKLEIRTRYNDWFSRMCEYGFAENEDYVLVTQKRATNNPKNPETTYADHQLTIEMAKQICMIQRTEIGKQYREYFIELEKKWNSPELVMARALKMANHQIEQITGQLTAANNIIEEQKQTIAEKDKEIEHKEDVICGLVDDIDLATKRQRITQIIRFHSKTGEAIADKWKLLYSEFEKKYHVNLSVRFNNHKDTYKPKLKNEVDLIDRQMDMIPQLYEVCCKLFKNDVKVLREEWESAIAC